MHELVEMVYQAWVDRFTRLGWTCWPGLGKKVDQAYLYSPNRFICRGPGGVVRRVHELFDDALMLPGIIFHSNLQCLVIRPSKTQHKINILMKLCCRSYFFIVIYSVWWSDPQQHIIKSTFEYNFCILAERCSTFWDLTAKSKSYLSLRVEHCELAIHPQSTCQNGANAALCPTPRVCDRAILSTLIAVIPGN